MTTTPDRIEAIALAVRMEHDGDQTELCSMDFILDVNTSLEYLNTVELAKTGEDCYSLENDGDRILGIFYCYYPAGVEASPQEYLDAFVAVVQS